MTSPDNTSCEPLVRTFTEAEPYEQDEPGEAHFRWLLRRDEVPGLQVGLVELVGPIHKTPAAHAEWNQAYIVLSGKATIHLGEDTHHVTEPTVVVIPKGTMHSVAVSAGDRVQYVFANQYR